MEDLVRKFGKQREREKVVIILRVCGVRIMIVIVFGYQYLSYSVGRNYVDDSDRYQE